MYSSVAELTAQLGDDEVSALALLPDGTLDTARLTEALERASDEADSYLCGRYFVPLAPVPRVLTGCINCMARYHLCGGSFGQDAEEVTRRYDAAIAWLKNVARGLASIPGQPSPTTNTDAGVLFDAGIRVWAENSATLGTKEA